MSEDNDLISAKKSDGVLTITIQRPKKKNAINAAMYFSMADHLKDAALDNTVRCIVITGVDDVFTSGSDLAGFEDASSDPQESPAAYFIHAISTCQKPIVAAVNGVAVGIGVTLLLHCDFVYASALAKFQMPFVRLGVCPEAGSSMLLPALVGHQKASEWLLLGEMFSAEEAYEAGLINCVLNCNNSLSEQARRVAAQLAKTPLQALVASKRLIKQCHSSVADCVDEEFSIFYQLLETDDAKEARAAFRERRKPVFR